MRTLSKATSFFILVLLLISTPALACTTQSPYLESLTVDLDPVVVSLFNNPDLGDTDNFSLCAIDLSYPNNSYDLLFNVAGSDDWQNFNTMFGPFMYANFDLSESSSNIIDLNLGLYDSDLLVSEKAEVTFFSFEPQQTGEYNWYDWVVLNWLDDNDTPLNVSTFLSTFPCGDPYDMVGTTAAVPIPGTGLLLSLGILCLIGRRNSQK
jgi:hypothetical protein